LQPTPTTDDDTGFVARLATIDGLDTEFGLRSVRGRAGSYRRLARLYAESHGGDLDTVRHQLEAGDLKSACRGAHSLKGAAATLGATAVQKLATELEQLLRDGATTLAAFDLIDRVDYLNRSLCRSIIAADREGPGHASGNPQIARKTLGHLASLIREDDVRAAALFKESLPMLQSLFGEDCKQLARDLEQFDFEAAQITLAGLIDRMPPEPRDDA